jgi:DinB superfamily
MPLPARAPDRKLNPEIDRLAFQIKMIREEAEGLTVAMSQEQLTWRPAPGRWSVLECFVHLNITNRKMIVEIEKSIAAGRQANMISEGPFVYGFLSRMFLRMTEPPVSKRFKAPPAFLPPSNQAWADVAAEWKSTHDKMEELLLKANGLDLTRVKTQSPAASWMKYPLGVGFWLQTTHDKRHLWQAREVINSASFPKAAVAEKLHA